MFTGTEFRRSLKPRRVAHKYMIRDGETAEQGPRSMGAVVLLSKIRGREADCAPVLHRIGSAEYFIRARHTGRHFIHALAPRFFSCANKVPALPVERGHR